MENNFISHIYKDKYKGQFSYDQYLTFLNKGQKILKKRKENSNMTDQEVMAMNIALDYNMQVVVYQLGATDDLDEIDFL